MSKLKKISTTPIILSDQLSIEIESTSKLNPQTSSLPKKKSNSKKITNNANPTNTNDSPIHQQTPPPPQMKRRTNKAGGGSEKENNRKNDSDFDSKFERLEPIPITYCININQDGYPNMDRACHFNEEEMEHRLLENKLRPISGIRNHLKRNMSAPLSNRFPTFDFIKDTDIIQRISSVKHLKRLDLSYNNLQTYPRQLCDLIFLETLNLTGNNLTENDFPNDFEKYQNLIELIIDLNNCKRVSKNICKCKKLNRLSMRHNNLHELKHVENLKKLRFLIVDYNNLTSLDESLKNLDKLEILQVNNNSLSNIDLNLFKSSFTCLKQLNLSFNKLNTISVDAFMLPNLEILNLSNNNIQRLPLIPNNTYFRTMPIFSIDLSSNQLVRYYDYLLSIAKNVDLSYNKIKYIQSKSIQKLTNAELNSKNLKLYENPIVDPPNEIGNYSLKELKEYFEEEAKNIQMNKGFKILILGDQKSGKTSLSYALEDFNSQSNLMEQSTVNNSQILEDISESKLMGIHEFCFADEEEEELEKNTNQSQSDIRINSSLSFKSQKSDLKRINSALSVKSNEKTKVNTNFISNSFRTNTSTVPKKTSLPVTIYDFNGSISQYGHLFDLFVDKTSLIILCIDCSNYSFSNETQTNKTEKFEKYLAKLLDLIFFKMSKNTSFFILPLLTKCDKIPKGEIGSTQSPTRIIASRVENFIKNHLANRLNDIQIELKKIEQLNHISASQSDRLKQLVQNQSNINPEIYKKCLTCSSLKMTGIGILSRTIKELVLNNKKNFPHVNEKVPAFWTEVEDYTLRIMGELPVTKFVNEKLKITTHHGNPNNSMLYVDYNQYKEKIVEKFGMSHLVEQIVKYLNTNGKVMWYQDSHRLKTNIFLRPAALFDMYFVLFRTNFDENFKDNHTAALRVKLIDNPDITDATITKMTNDLLQKGQMHIELLKLLWYPILIIDSVNILYEIAMIFMFYFNLGYPQLSKDKLRILFEPYLMNDKSEQNKYLTPESTQTTVPKPVLTFNSVIIPFYLPNLKDKIEITKIKQTLALDCKNNSDQAIALKLRKERTRLIPHISQKYSFPWGLITGIFDKFSSNCIINSSLYYKVHYRNFIHASNEENDIEIIIYVNHTTQKPGEEIDELVFEFYLVSYHQVIDNLEQSEKIKEDNFEQTLSNDLDHVWNLALKVLGIFEETIYSTWPSLRYDRFSQCPECEKYSMIGEWLTPKELQKYKSKNCSSCQATIDYSFLVKPSSQHITMDPKKMSLRLENIAKKHSKTHPAPPSTVASTHNKSQISTSDINSIKSKSKASI